MWMTPGLKRRYMDDDECEAGIILEYFKEVDIILDAFHLMKRYGDSTVGSQHPAHNGAPQHLYQFVQPYQFVLPGGASEGRDPVY